MFLESIRKVPVARAAFKVSQVGLTTFASGLYDVMSRGVGKRKKKNVSVKGKIKTKLQMREKNNAKKSHNFAAERIIIN